MGKSRTGQRIRYSIGRHLTHLGRGPCSDEMHSTDEHQASPFTMTASEAAIRTTRKNIHRFAADNGIVNASYFEMRPYMTNGNYGPERSKLGQELTLLRLTVCLAIRCIPWVRK